MNKAYIVGAGMTPLGKHWDKSVKQLSAQAIDLALADAGIDKTQIEAAWFCNTRLGVLQGQHNIRGQVALRAYGFENIPIFNTDNACASSSSGLAQAWAAVLSGLHDVVLVVGAEKMNFRDKEQQMFEAFKGSSDIELFDEQMEKLLAIGADLPLPEKALANAGQRSVFMDIYSAMARYHMKRFGTTEEQIADVAAKNHWHSQWNPLAQYREPMTREQVLADKLISYPMTRAMCAPMSDGAAALVIVSERALKRFDSNRAVGIRAVAVSSGSNRQPDELEKHLTRTAADRAYELAGLGPNCTMPPLSRKSCKASIAVSQPMARAARWSPAVLHALAVACRSTSQADFCPRAIRLVQPVPFRSTRSSRSCAARLASARLRMHASVFAKTAAATTVTKRLPASCPSSKHRRGSHGDQS